MAKTMNDKTRSTRGFSVLFSFGSDWGNSSRWGIRFRPTGVVKLHVSFGFGTMLVARADIENYLINSRK